MGVLTRKRKQEKRQSAFLRVVHPHGYVELFREPITAGEILTRYPRHRIARPDFFEHPWVVVRDESVLVPGQVFFLVAHKTIDRALKEKKQQMQSANQRIQVTPRDQQEERHYTRQNNHDHDHHHRHHHRSDEESHSNGRQEQNSEILYRHLFYESWNKMQRYIHRPNQDLDAELDSPVHSGRPHVTSPEQVELQRVKSCLRKADTGRRKLNLKVTFASPVVIPGSQRWSPSIQQDDLILQV